MKTYRKNAVMAGILYFLGTVFGILGGVVGGEVLSSFSFGKPLVGVDLLGIVAANSSRITGGSFLYLMMGISLMAMGMILFRGVLEGTFYFISTLGFLALVLLGNEYIIAGADPAVLQSIANVLYQFQGCLAPTGTILFLIGAVCLYISFYRTRLIPRWLSVWGFIGVVAYMASQLLKVFNMDPGIGFYLEMVLAPQEIVMALWLIVKGFNRSAITALFAKTE